MKPTLRGEKTAVPPPRGEKTQHQSTVWHTCVGTWLLVAVGIGTRCFSSPVTSADTKKSEIICPPPRQRPHTHQLRPQHARPHPRSYFGTSPEPWNYLLKGMTLLPDSIMGNRDLMQALAEFSEPLVRLTDKLVSVKKMMYR